MKINDVEKLLGITKANIRFYEKENLLSPHRSENGYRDYSGEDITRLKTIVILRKLGLPVQTIADILDGATPLQDALETNISLLLSEINKLNGSLALCRQLQTEQAEILDTERYWQLLHDREAQGHRFQSLLDDYLNFTEIGYEWLIWPLPVENLRKPRNLCLFILAISALNALSACLLSDENFFYMFAKGILSWLRSIALWTALFVPLYLLSKRKPKLADRIMRIFMIAFPITILAVVIWVFLKMYTA